MLEDDFVNAIALPVVDREISFSVATTVTVPAAASSVTVKVAV